MDDKFNLRRADARDVLSLVEFNQAMAAETESKQLDTTTLTAGVEHLLQRAAYGFYVVAEDSSDDKNEVVGSLMITFEWSDWRDGLFWWVQSVYVKPEFRRRGVYRRLYDFVKSEAKSDERVRGFRLYVEKENEIAQATYEKLGMAEAHYLMFEELLGA